jgi:hypothetical protein
VRSSLIGANSTTSWSARAEDFPRDLVFLLCSSRHVTTDQKPAVDRQIGVTREWSGPSRHSDHIIQAIWLSFLVHASAPTKSLLPSAPAGWARSIAPPTPT